MRYLLKCLLVLVIGFILNSCEENKNIRYYNLNIELKEPLAGFKENDPLPSYLKVLVNYIDTNCTKELFVPVVVFKRMDFNPPKVFNLKPPLSWLNTFRNSRGMLPAQYLKEDYDKLLEDTGTPEILIERKGTIQSVERATDLKTSVFVLNLKTANNDSISILQQKIIRRLCESKGNITITVELANFKPDNSTAENIQNTFVKPKIDSIAPVIKPEITNQVTTNVIQDPTNIKGKDSIKVKVNITKPVINPTTPIKPESQKSPGGRTIKINGDIYTGEVLNGKPHGWGKMTFKQGKQLTPDDINKQRIEAGESLVGNWKNGEFSDGQVFDSNGKYKRTIIIGSN